MKTNRNRVLIIKLILIALYFSAMLLFFSDELFNLSTQTVHQFNDTLFMITSISFGVIIVAVLYNFALYINMRKKQYLYYSLAQLFALLFLINLDSLFISPFDTIFGLKSIAFFDISQLFMLAFSLLFLETFFESYGVVEIKKIVRGILFFILLDIVSITLFYHSFFMRTIPIFIPIFLVLSEAIRYVEKRDLPFYLLLMGWSTVISIVGFEYFGILNFLGVIFPFLHVAIALESILLSLAIAYKFRLMEEEQQEQKMLMFQQSRLASMGEMMSSIVHQWRQPLNIISFGLMNIKKNSKEEKNLKTIEKLNYQVQYMSQTIEDFRNFYNPSKVKEKFDVYQAVENSHKIASAILEKNSINFKIEVKENFSLYGYQNELEQVILNIINNAKDAFISSSIDEPNITITIDNHTIYIKDNAGGVKKEYQKRIFERYFSTKKDSDGIGLYLSKMIIEKEFQGRLSIQNIKNGTIFIINF